MTQAPRPRLALLVALTGLSVLSLNMFLPALASIAADLKADYALVSLAVAGYLAVTAVVQLVVGPLSDRIGRRPVILASPALFVLASALAAMAKDVLSFLLCRMFQSAMIAGHAFRRRWCGTRPPNARRRGSSARSTWPWRWRLCLGLCWAGCWTRISAGAPISGCMPGQGPRFWRCAGWICPRPGPAAPPGNTLRETRLLLGDRRFWGFALCTAFSIGAFYIFLAGAPLVATEAFGLSSAVLGIFVGSITAGFFLGSAVARRLATRLAPATLMIAGRVVACSGLSLGLLLWAAGVQMPVTYF